MSTTHKLSPSYNTTQKTIKALRKFITKHKDYFKYHVVTAFAFYKRDEVELWQAIRYFGGINFLNDTWQLQLKTKHIGWTEKKLMRVLWKLYHQGQTISVNGLKAIGRTDLLTIAKSISTIGEIKIKMGLAQRRNKWTKEKVLNQYQTLYKKWQKVPTSTELTRRGYAALVQAIRKYFKTLGKIRHELNLMNPKKQNNYWSLRKTKEVLKKFHNTNKLQIEKTSLTRTIIDQKNFSLMNAVHKHGGFKKLNKELKLGLVLWGEIWSEEKVFQILRKVIKNGDDLTKTNIIKFGGQALVGAVSLPIF